MKFFAPPQRLPIPSDATDLCVGQVLTVAVTAHWSLQRTPVRARVLDRQPQTQTQRQSNNVSVGHRRGVLTRFKIVVDDVELSELKTLYNTRPAAAAVDASAGAGGEGAGAATQHRAAPSVFFCDARETRTGGFLGTSRETNMLQVLLLLFFVFCMEKIQLLALT